MVHHRITITLVFLFLFQHANSQWFIDSKRDYQWIMGWGNYSPPLPLYGGVGIDFITNHPVAFNFPHQLFLSFQNTAISGFTGQLLFFTDGRTIINKEGLIMKNGDSLCNTNNWSLFPDFYPGAHGARILPHISNPNLYYIIHEDITQSIELGVFVHPLRFSIVDITQDNGLGEVTEKSVVLINDTLNYSVMATVRHGNGRDWWILIPEFKDNSYYTVLLNDQGLQVIGKQNTGHQNIFNETGKSVFSPDGNWYARSGDSSAFTPVRLELYQFDRCTGLLSDYHDLGGFIPPLNGSRGGFLEFSPNSKLLYYTTLLEVYQYNLDAPDIQSSKTLVAQWDSTYYNFAPIGFVEPQLGPDSKIYISSDNNPYIHVIENPDIPGIGCNVVQRGLILPKNSFIIPTFPNFRLGPKIGSVCDTIYHAGVEDMLNFNKMSAYPNPASEFIQFELDITNNYLPMRMCIYDYVGKQVDDLYVAPYQGVIRYNVHSLPAGVYMGVLRNENTQIAKVKFIVE